MPPLHAIPQPRPAQLKDTQDSFMEMYVPHPNLHPIGKTFTYHSTSITNPPLLRLQGPSITLHLGPRRYTMPIPLLYAYSNYFRAEIRRLVHTSGMGTKKRKLNSGDVNAQDDDDWQSQTLSLVLSEEIDHPSFALFTRFMYTGQYPVAIDATAKRLPPAPTIVNPATQPLPRAGKVSSINTLTGPITPSHFSETSTAIPPSIHAYMLAHRLHALSFMNHALTRIYHGVGSYFALTPQLIDFVWRNTPSQTPSSSISYPQVPPSSFPHTPTPQHPAPTLQAPSTSPLRTLLLDILTTYWPSAHTHIIARNQQAEWSKVFEAHAELRKTLIFGMQMGGSKVRECSAYLAGGMEVFGKLEVRAVEAGEMVDDGKGEDAKEGGEVGGGEQEKEKGGMEEKEVQMAKGSDGVAVKVEGEEKEK
jgi:hypothetical protein